jgi:hypothetical protein
MDKLFYVAGISGESNDSEGVDSNGLNARIAYDFTKNMMLGAFTSSGSRAETTAPVAPERSYARHGIDFQADIGNSRIQAAYITAKDDNATDTNVDKNDAYSLQYIYHIKTATGSPTLVPVVRFDSYEKSNGIDKYQEVTLNLTYYINENFKGFIEYWDQLSVPGSVTADNRTTLQFSVGF